VTRTINLEKIVDLRKIAKYKMTGKLGSEFIFRKKDDLNTQNTINSMRQQFKYTQKKDEKLLLESGDEDDVGIAEEFDENEKKIETDIKRRSTLRAGKLFIPQNFVTPSKPMLGLPLGFTDRPRSISTAVTGTNNLFSARKFQDRYLRVTPFENKHFKTTGGPPQCEGDFVESSIKLGIEQNDSTEVNPFVLEGSVGQIRNLKINSPQKNTASPMSEKHSTSVKLSMTQANFIERAASQILKSQTTLIPKNNEEIKNDYEFNSVKELLRQKTQNFNSIGLSGLFGRTKNSPLSKDEKFQKANMTPSKNRFDI